MSNIEERLNKMSPEMRFYLLRDLPSQGEREFLVTRRFSHLIDPAVKRWARERRWSLIVTSRPVHLHSFWWTLHIAFRPAKKACWLHTNDGALNVSRPHLAHSWQVLTGGGLAPCPACEIALPPLLQIGIVYLDPPLHEQDMGWLSQAVDSVNTLSLAL